MRNKALVAIVAVVVLVGTMASNRSTTQAAETSPKQIVVSGTATVKTKPDVAIVNVGVHTENTDSKVAQEQNTKTLNSVLDAVKKQGITENDMQTSNFSIYPVYDYERGANTIRGYSVTNSLTIRVTQLDNAGKVLDAAIAAGANQVNGIQFTIADTTAIYQEALTKAMANGKIKADTIAKALGVTVGQPVMVVEGGSSYVPVVRATAYSTKLEDAAATGIIAGETEVSASVTLTYEY